MKTFKIEQNKYKKGTNLQGYGERKGKWAKMDCSSL